MEPEDPLLLNEPRLRALLRYFSAQSFNPGQRIPHPDQRVDELTRKTSQTFRKASVLIPVVKPSPESPSQIVLTVRSPELSSHAGQVSLPGGTREVQDTDEIMTALREAEEEIGLAPESVQVLGRLGQILLPSGFEVTPVIGLLEPAPVLRPCPVEVHEIFTAPTSLLMTPSSYLESAMDYRGESRRILELHYQGFRVWGATAAILHHLACELESLDAVSGKA
ncbi:MAG: CoA pyrophosphatase [Gammaproteobacteria bacterium]|nr:CoA pyrophosphatase [Pseudomonadales bacterium]MCP5349134.1 CoA pyrophosphatase [Pseudomonadales bacterium]